MLLITFFLFSIFFQHVCSSCPSTTSFILGTFTENVHYPQLQGEGLSILHFQNGKLIPSLLLNASYVGPNPNYVVTDGASMHIVNAMSDMRSSLTSVKFLSSPPFIELTRTLLPHYHPNHVALYMPPAALPTRKVLLVSNMDGARVSSFVVGDDSVPVLADHMVPPVSANPRDGGNIHGTMPIPDRHMALVMGFGDDVVHSMHVNPYTGKLTLLQTLRLENGDAPRHAIFHPPSRLAIVICELSRTLTVLSTDDEGVIKVVQRVSVLPEDQQFPGGGSSGIRMSKDNRFVYVAVTMTPPLNGYIAAFSIAENGMLSRIGYTSSYGVHPHDFYLMENVRLGDECVSYVAVPNMLSDNLIWLRRDPVSGMISDVPNFTHSIKGGAFIMQMEDK